MENLWNETDPLIVAGVLLIALILTYTLGLLIGKRRPLDSQNPAVSKIADSTLALMGLLLGFSFAMALSKYDRRREMVVTDSNSIGDFYTAVCMLKDSPQRVQLIKEIRAYTEYRLDLSRTGRIHVEEQQDAMDKIADMQSRMTDLVRQAIHDGTPVANPLVNTLNEVTSAHAARVAALRDRLPVSIVALLFLATAVSIGMLGFQQGGSQRGFCYTTLWLVILIIAALYVTMDLNQPSRGLIRISQAPLEWLLRSMGPAMGPATGPPGS